MDSTDCLHILMHLYVFITNKIRGKEVIYFRGNEDSIGGIGERGKECHHLLIKLTFVKSQTCWYMLIQKQRG